MNVRLRFPVAIAVLLTMYSGLSSGHAAEYQEIHRCDEVAAHPDDIQKWSTGVEERDLAPPLAIKHCSQAVSEHPDTARFHFQLGRALLKARHFDLAFDALKRAAEFDSAAAFAYLGDMYQFGLAVDVDTEQARELYEIALDDGFEPALAALEAMSGETESDSVEDADFSRFEREDIMHALYAGQFGSLEPKRYLVLNYLVGVNEFFIDQSLYIEPECALLAEAKFSIDAANAALQAVGAGTVANPNAQNILELLQSGLQDLSQGGQGLKQAAIEREIHKRQGIHDGKRLALEYTCTHPLTTTVYENAKRFVRKQAPVSRDKENEVSDKAPAAEPAEQMATKSSMEVSTHHVHASCARATSDDLEWCNCLIWSLGETFSPADLTRLTKNFNIRYILAHGRRFPEEFAKYQEHCAK